MEKLNYKLLPNQVCLIDENTNLQWIYEINDQGEWEFVKSRGRMDEFGNIILSAPIIAALKRWTPETAMNKVDEYLEDVNVPEIPKPSKRQGLAELSSLVHSTNEQLEEMLLIYGGYKAYLEAQLSNVESKKGILEASFEEGLAKTIFSLQQQKEQKVTKDILRGEALTTNAQLKKVRQDLIEMEAIYARIKGMRDSYKALWDSVSRVVALRISSKEMS